MAKKCLKCGCINPRQAEDPAPGDKCPMCGAFYDEPPLAVTVKCLKCGHIEKAMVHGDKCPKCRELYNEPTPALICCKCGYTRNDDDTAPDYECPKCGVIYLKAEAAIAQKNKVTAEKEAKEKIAAMKWAMEVADAEKEAKERSAKEKPTKERPTKEMRRVICQACGSDQITANTKGIGVRNALVGGFLLGGVGLLAGFAGRRKIIITCMNCGHHWGAGS